MKVFLIADATKFRNLINSLFSGRIYDPNSNTYINVCQSVLLRENEKVSPGATALLQPIQMNVKVNRIALIYLLSSFRLALTTSFIENSTLFPASVDLILKKYR